MANMMRAVIVVLGFGASATIAGCSGAPDDTTDSEVTQSVQELVLLECTDQAAVCIRNARTVSDLATCNEAYAQCLLGQPQEVADALDAVTDCAQDALTCVETAQTPAQLLSCSEGRVSCVGDALGVAVPEPSQALGCADDAQTCVTNAASIADLTACAEGFATCATDFTADVIGAVPLPQEVTDIVDTTVTCTQGLEACVFAAATPSDLLACEETHVGCVAGALGVDLPSISEAVDCADEAAQCVFNAASIADLEACATGLTSCASASVGVSTGIPLIDCTAQLAQCLATNPFGALQCADQARQCALATP